MTKQVSNNTLLILITATIMVSIIGTWVTITRITPITGAVTGTTNVSINATSGISLITSLVNFTEATPGESRSTYRASDIKSGPFNISNDGTVFVNITMSATAIFTSPSFTMPSKDYLYNVTILRALRPGAGASPSFSICRTMASHSAVACARVTPGRSRPVNS